MPTQTSFCKIQFLVLLFLPFKHIKCMQGTEFIPTSEDGLAAHAHNFDQKKKNLEDPDTTAEIPGLEKDSGYKKEPSQFSEHSVEKTGSDGSLILNKSFSHKCDPHPAGIFAHETRKQIFTTTEPQKSPGSSFTLENKLTIPKIDEIPPEDLNKVGKFLSTTFPLNKQNIIAMDFPKPKNDFSIIQDCLRRIITDVEKSYEDSQPQLLGSMKQDLGFLIGKLKKFHDHFSFYPDMFTQEIKEFLKYIHDLCEAQAHSSDSYRISVTIEDVAYQIMNLRYNQGKISKLKVKELISGREDALASTMVANYKLKYGDFFEFRHEKGITKYFSSQFIGSDWQFPHYKPLVDVLQLTNQRQFMWSTHKQFIKGCDGKYKSEIFKSDYFFHVFEFHFLPWYSKTSYGNIFKYQKGFTEIEKIINNLKGIFMDHNNPDILHRLYSFLDLQALERIYPGITLKVGNLIQKDYEDNLNSMSFACHHFQDTENIKRFINYKLGKDDAYGKFSIPSSLEKPEKFIQDEPLQIDKLIKYIQITLAKADSKVSENDSIVIKSLFSDPISIFKKDTQEFVSANLKT